MGDNDVPEGSGDVPGWRPRGGAHIKTALDWAGLSSFIDLHSHKKPTFFSQVLMDFHPTFFKENDQNRPQQVPRALNPIAIPYLKVLTSIFWLLKRVSYFYRPAESEETDILKPGFDGISPHFFQRK